MRKTKRAKKKARKMRTAAIVTINNPGAMTRKGAKMVAAWLRKTASYLSNPKLQKQLNDTGPFRAKYFYLATLIALIGFSANATKITVNPGQSINVAIGSAQAGDTVIVNAGTYTGSIVGKTGVRVQASGLVTIYGGANLTCNNCSIVGFRFDHGSVWMKGNDILLEGNQFKGKGGSEDYGNLFGERITVRRNLFYGVRIPDDLASIGGGNYEHNDVLQFWDNNGEVLRSVVIEENIFTDYVQGVFLALETGTVSRVSNWTVRNNVFWGTDFVSTGNLIGNPSHGMFAGKYAVPGVSITNNLFYNNANQVSIYGGGASAIVQGNIIMNGGTAYAVGDGSSSGAFVRGTVGNILFQNSWNGYPAQGPDKYISPMLANVNSLLGADGVPFTADDGWRATAPGAAGYGPQIGAGTTPPPPTPLANVAPTANAGADQSVTLASGASAYLALLIGSGTDTDGTVVSYRWTGTPDPDDLASPTVSLVAGTYTFALVVTDNLGLASAEDRVTLTVLPTPLAPPPPPAPSLVWSRVPIFNSDGRRVGFRWALTTPTDVKP